MQTLEDLRHDIYHTPRYVNIEAEGAGAVAEAFLAADGEQRLFVPYLVRGCESISADASDGGLDVTSPAGYPGPLVSDAAQQDAEFQSTAVQQLIGHLESRGACSAFLRLHPILSDMQDDAFGSRAVIRDGQTVSVDLSLSEEQLWNHTRKGHRSTINKCKRLGLTFRVVPYAEYLGEFQAVYQQTMDRVKAGRSYYFDEGYFQRLADLGDQLHLAIVEQNEEVVAAIMLFECRGIVQAHLGGTKTDFLNQSPFHLLLHEARLWAKQRGNRVLHLGGGIGGADDDALFRFKSGFSKQRHRFRTVRYVLDWTRYRELTDSRAAALGVTTEHLLASDFFPAYRSTE